jgi:hypothetical protein
MSQFEYVHVDIHNVIHRPSVFNWYRYQEIFDQCTNLKGIELTTSSKSIEEILPTLSESHQKIWKERIEYFQSKNIRLVKKNEIDGNENLRKKLAKEAGIKWRFHVY